MIRIIIEVICILAFKSTGALAGPAQVIGVGVGRDWGPSAAVEQAKQRAEESAQEQCQSQVEQTGDWGGTLQCIEGDCKAVRSSNFNCLTASAPNPSPLALIARVPTAGPSCYNALGSVCEDGYQVAVCNPSTGHYGVEMCTCCRP